MEKKQYIKPSMIVYDMKPSRLMCTSGDDWNLNYLPTIPGQPDNENHLA